MSAPSHPQPRSSTSEVLLAGILSLILGLVVVGRPVWDSDLIYLASDTATVQAPWSVPGPAINPELSDSAVAFYPHYRRVSESWRAGEVPLWNPDIFVGVPLLANAQWGALDPQVLSMILVEAALGERAFDMSFAWLAVLRVAAAALGAFLLARSLGLARTGAALAGATFALSGSVILWLGFSLAHVTPCLPWVLLGIEGLRRGRCPRRAFLTTALALALAIYGGHPEVSFYVGLLAGVWAFTVMKDSHKGGALALAALGTGVLLAMPVLLPFVEYLRHSGALLAHRMAPIERRVPELVSLGALIVFLAFLGQWRRWSSVKETDATWSRSALVALPIVLAALGWLLVTSGRGASFDPGLAACAELEPGSGRLPVAASLLVLVALFNGARGLRGALPLAVLGGLAWLLTIGVPGVVDLWHWLPIVGLAAPQRAACCAALCLSLLAGAGLQQAGRNGRLAAVLAFASLAVVASLRSETEPLDVRHGGLDAADEIVRFSALPPEVLDEGTARLEGELHGRLDVDGLRLAFESLDRAGQVLSEAPFVRWARLELVGENGVKSFDFGDLELRELGAGNWRLRLEFIDEGVVVGKRHAALVHMPAPAMANALGAALLALAALALLFLEVGAGGLVLVLLTIIGGVLGAREWNPAVERARHFRATRTHAWLNEHLAGERFFSEAGVFPGSTALMTRASTIDGYDAMDAATFDGYRAYALKPGMNPLLDWNVTGAAFESPAFRLFGVRALLTRSARAFPGWEIVAGPEGFAEVTEVFVHRALDPLPRAFCVQEIVNRASVLAAPADFDPRHSAFVEDEATFDLEAPWRKCVVKELERTGRTLEYDVELDGEGLFVSTEQHFPGWRATVDGESREILRTNSLFRGLFLEAGRHRVKFVYAPASWRYGKWLGALGLLALVVGAACARRVNRPE